MAEYLVYKLERFRDAGNDHVSNQVKYFFEEIIDTKRKDFRLEEIKHPYTDDNPHRLFGQIASLYRPGDVIKTICCPEILDSFGGTEVQLKEPLSHDELRILSVQILEFLKSLKEKK